MADPNAGDTDRGNNPSEPINPSVVARAAAEPIHVDETFPGGGAVGGTPDSEIALGEEVGGSTGRGADEEGKADAEGLPGGGMAGSAGG